MQPGRSQQRGSSNLVALNRLTRSSDRGATRSPVTSPVLDNEERDRSDMIMLQPEPSDGGAAAAKRDGTPGRRSPVKAIKEEGGVVSRSWMGISLKLKNTGSVARDHLANERTFLAWMRTSLTMSTLGVAVAQLFGLTQSTMSSLPPFPNLDELFATPASSLEIEQLRELIRSQQNLLELLTQTPPSHRHRFGKPLGALFVAISFVFLCLGLARYFRCQGVMVENPSRFPPSRRSVIMVTLLIGSLCIIAFAFVLV